MQNAILVKTSENRYLLAEENTKPSLLSYAKTFKATLSMVACKQKPKNIAKVVEGLNDPASLSDTKPTVSSEVLIYSPPAEEVDHSANTVIQRENYQEYLDQAGMVKEYIKKQLVEGNSISLNTIQDWANQKNITLSKGGLSRHLQKVLDWAVGQGWTKQKDGRSYKITRG